MAELLHAEILGEHARIWSAISVKHKERLLRSDRFLFVSRFDGNKVMFYAGAIEDNRKNDLEQFEDQIRLILREYGNVPKSTRVLIQYRTQKESISSLMTRYPNYREKFNTLTFGSDVAEQDANLMQYFLETNAFGRVASFQKGVVIGAKGSGKSSILRAMVSQNPTSHSIIITPEIFATSMLRRILEEGQDCWEEERAFVATWEFTILFEVFKHISRNPKGIHGNALSDIRRFLHSHSEFADTDIFSRFILYLRRIQTVKLKDIEISIKTRQLQELYSLEGLYNVVLKTRHHLKHKILILIDELDQGWDNSEHSNRFLAGLLQAAVQIQNLGIQARVIVLVRSEIFDLVRSRLAQLDKIRSSIERLRWSDGEIMNVVSKRVAYHFGPSFGGYDAREILSLLFERTAQIAGFDYIISRTARRPREILQFARLAHQYAVEGGHTSIDETSILRAEEEFSTWKIEHVAAEYLHIYPSLEALMRAFRGKQARLSRQEIYETIEAVRTDGLIREAWFEAEPQELLSILFQVEFIGVPRPTGSRAAVREDREFEFSYEAASPNLNVPGEFLVHPSLWKGLELIG